MAEIPFVDTHFHLHDLKHPDLRYGWLERDAVHGFLGNIDALKPQHYWIEDYIAEIRFSNVPKAIHVQAAVGMPDPVDETEWLQAFADKTGYPQGIVAECHLQRRRRGRGARAAHCSSPMSAASAISARRLSRRSGLAARLSELLARHNLVYCLDTRLPLFADRCSTLARNCPDTMICVDHCAHPDGARRRTISGAGARR